VHVTSLAIRRRQEDDGDTGYEVSWESCLRSVAVVAVGLAAVVPAASMAAPAAKPKKCRAGKVAAVVGGKKKCLSVSTLSAAAPGTNAPDMLIQLTARKPLWPKKAAPSVFKALGKYSAGVLAFDRALYAAGRAAGKPLVPHDPLGAGKRSGGVDETLNLNIPPAVQWMLEHADRTEGGNDDPSGVQTREAVTSARMLKLPADANGDYKVYLSEKFQGDPCPKAGGLVEGTATYSIERDTGSLFGGVENVATVTVVFKATVDKTATIKSYNLTSVIVANEGWRGAVSAKGLKPGAFTRDTSLSAFIVAGTSDLAPLAQEQVAAATVQALRRAKEDIDRWLVGAQEQFKDKARCKKASGDNLKKMKTGETRTIQLDVQSIRGARADEEIQLKGQNGLEIVSPTGKVTAKGGKVSVQVRGTKGHAKTLAALAQPYVLEVDSLSELGRGATTVEIPHAGNYQFKGRVRENDFTQCPGDFACNPPRPAGETLVDFHVCGDPLTDAWAGQLSYRSEGSLLVGDATWTFSAGTYTSPIRFGYPYTGVAGTLDLDADPPVAHFRVRAFDGTILMPTLELTDYDGCPP
jgi:hypothetical protein